MIFFNLYALLIIISTQLLGLITTTTAIPWTPKYSTTTAAYSTTTHSTTTYTPRPGPPSPWHYALMARYIIHNEDWVSISTISTISEIKSYPFVNLKSMSDGPLLQGSGVPYLYMTELDLSGLDIEKDNRCSVLASLAETDYCKSNDFDPQDPRCARVILSGRLVKVQNTTEEYNYAKNALFSRHPSMRYWPIEHHFYVAKVNIEQIAVLDYFGGVHYVSVSDYFSATHMFLDNDEEFDNVVVDIIA